MASGYNDHDYRQPQRQQSVDHSDRRAASRPRSVRRDDFSKDHQSHDDVSGGTPLNDILDICRDPPLLRDMDKVKDSSCIYLISPFKYDPSSPNREPKPTNDGMGYFDQVDKNHVYMPCSPKLIDKNRKSKWLKKWDVLGRLRAKCDARTATISDLKTAIESCSERPYNTENLEVLINQYSPGERADFMSTVLANICSLAIDVGTICSRPPPLLRIGKCQSVTMSQRQAAALLACAFFCLFPNRSEHDLDKEYENFQNPNFNRLYQRGPQEKTEKLKCILHYFRRIAEKMPTGVITFRRFTLAKNLHPDWPKSKARLSKVHMTTDKKIEDISCVLQVDFANKYIGGGVLGNGCVQEEIRFSLCPEMLVSLLVCEMMEPNECIFLVGCERYSNYEGYAGSFKFDGNYVDKSPKDNWGRRWCHLVAMDAVCFRNREAQYEMREVTRELIKAFVSFRPRPTTIGAENLYGIATGHWGCGVFNGDKQLKAIIQLMAAAEAQRPLVYAAYRDPTFVKDFAQVYDFLSRQEATVSDLYYYIAWYSKEHTRGPLFDLILKNPISTSKL